MTNQTAITSKQLSAEIGFVTCFGPDHDPQMQSVLEEMEALRAEVKAAEEATPFQVELARRLFAEVARNSNNPDRADNARDSLNWLSSN